MKVLPSLVFAASLGFTLAATATEPTCLISIEKQGSQCYPVKQCTVQNCDKTTGICTWEIKSERIGGSIPCLDRPRDPKPFPFGR